MRITERKCPNCGGDQIVKNNDSFVCKNCGALFDDENNITITETRILRNEAEIERIRAAERKDIRDNKESNRTALIILLLLLLLFGFIFYMAEREKTVPVDSAADYRNKPLDMVIGSLSDAGFTDIQAIPLNDLKPGENKKKNLVSTVTIAGDEIWIDRKILSKSKKTYDKDSPVRIYYHSEDSNAVIPAPEGNGFVYRGEKYEVVRKRMSDAGYTNITIQPLGDLLTADDEKYGKTDYVTIDGETEWSEGWLHGARKQFNRNLPIVIYYHSN